MNFPTDNPGAHVKHQAGLSHPTSNSSTNLAGSLTIHTPEAAPSHHRLLPPWPQSHSSLPSLFPTHTSPPIANSPGKANYLLKLKSDQYYLLLKTLLELPIPPGTDLMRPCLCPLLTVPRTVLSTILWILQLHNLLWGPLHLLVPHLKCSSHTYHHGSLPHIGQVSAQTSPLQRDPPGPLIWNRSSDHLLYSRI